MTTRDYSRLLNEISGAFSERFPRSAALQRDACRSLVDGGSHTLRLIKPFPPRIVSAHGGWVRDEDGHDILDFWQGHMANVLGHNPAVVTSELARAFRRWLRASGRHDGSAAGGGGRDPVPADRRRSGAPDHQRHPGEHVRGDAGACLHRPRSGAESGRRLARRTAVVLQGIRNSTPRTASASAASTARDCRQPSPTT